MPEKKSSLPVSQAQLDQQGAEVDPRFADTNPLSVLSMLPDRMVEAIRGLPEHYLEMAEEHLRRELFGVEAPRFTDNALRIGFWAEYERGCGNPLKDVREAWAGRGSTHQMIVSNIYSGICTNGHFYNHIIRNPARLAWMVRPPRNYKVANDELLSLAQERIREALQLSPLQLSPDGTTKWINVKLVEVQEKIRLNLENRQKGMLVGKNVNLNIESKVPGKGEEAELPPGMSAEQTLDFRIAELHEKMRKLNPSYEGARQRGLQPSPTTVPVLFDNNKVVMASTPRDPIRLHEGQPPAILNGEIVEKGGGDGSNISSAPGMPRGTRQRGKRFKPPGGGKPPT